MMDLLTLLKSIIHDLLAGEENGSLKNADFTKAWVTVVLLPISRICFIIDNAQHTKSGYDKNTAVYFGLLNRINDFLQNERRIVAAGLMDEELASFSRVLYLKRILNCSIIFAIRKNWMVLEGLQ